MKSKIRKIIISPSFFFCIVLLYIGIYIYFRHDNWIEHDNFSRYINYSTGFVYNGHKVHLANQYACDYHYAPVELITRPARWAEEKFWEIKQPKGSKYPKDWKLPLPDKDWYTVLQIGKSRSVTAYSELQTISKSNKDLPSGKLAATMLKLWDPILRTYISSEPRIVIKEQDIVPESIGHYSINIVVKTDGKVQSITLTNPAPPFELQREVMMHELYCPAKDGSDYIESQLSYIRMVCGI